MTELPKLTKKQQAILKRLYRFRFLNRIQIQALMGHKDPKTINLWLRDLRAKGYVEWIYSTHFAEKTKPAIYFLGLNGVRYLRTLTHASEDEDGNTAESPAYPPEELRKRYKEPMRSQTYIDRCILIADCCIALEKQDDENETKGGKLRYYYQTEADYLLERSYYHFILESELIQPSLVFCKDRLDNDSKEEETLASYLLEVFDPTLPRYRMKKRLGDYVKYLDDEDSEWQAQTNTENLPIVLFVCPRTTDLIYAKRRTRKLIADAWKWKDEDEERPRVRFTTMDALKKYGVLSKEAWEQA
ncbi:MAG TPA: replication-relaxation family protein [Candidatus Saccharimonadales bacterium]|nr:replication-relaxation family protein [Candidatus Saccharimonadales bacterium]